MGGLAFLDRPKACAGQASSGSREDFACASRIADRNCDGPYAHRHERGSESVHGGRPRAREGIPLPARPRSPRFVGYPDEDLKQLPKTAVESFAGVGYPFATKSIRPGDTVLDVGSGSGTDALYASLLAGPRGRVIGLDFTPAMIEKARANIERMGLTHV